MRATRLRYTASRFVPVAARRRWTRRLIGRSLRELSEVARSDAPIVVGPWLSEVGFELLYWIPLLRWTFQRYEVDPSRVVAVSRGGVDSWYADLASSYIEALDHVEVDDVAAARAARLRHTGSEKHLEIDSVDRSLYEFAASRTGSDAVWLHPGLMYRLFYWTWLYGDLRPFQEHTSHRTLHVPAAKGDLPDRYTAVKAYFSRAFEDTAANRDHLRRLVTALSAEDSVVVLRTGATPVDDHEQWLPAGVPVRIFETSAASVNLAEQSRVVAGAAKLVTTYGGFAYLGTYLACPTQSFYSTRWFNPAHERAFRSAVATMAIEPPPESASITSLTAELAGTR
jgi:hypothetical protein